MKLENGKLVIKLKFKDPWLSKSGKTFLVGSTHGIRKSKLEVDGRNIFYSANAYIKKPTRSAAIKQITKQKRRDSKA